MNNQIFEKTEIEQNEFDDEVIILNSKTGEFHSINEIGNEVIKKINGKNTVQDIINKIAKKYEQEEKIVEKDVQSFIKDLIKRKIIKLKK